MTDTARPSSASEPPAPTSGPSPAPSAEVADAASGGAGTPSGTDGTGSGGTGSGGTGSGGTGSGGTGSGGTGSGGTGSGGTGSGGTGSGGTGPGVGRRGFLAGVGLGALAGAALGAVGGAGLAGTSRPTAADPAAGDSITTGDAGPVTVPFHGLRQAGIAEPAPAHAVIAALDLLPGVDREALVRLMRVWTDDIARLTAGRPGLADTEPELAAHPASLTVTVGVGPGFLAAAGLSRLAPAWLAPLPAFAVDRLDPAWCDGDVVLQVCGDDPTVVAHALRLLTKDAVAFVAGRWQQRGFRHGTATTPAGTTMRNLMGQVDGTANLVVGRETPGRDDDLVWVGEEGPAWLRGGTSMVVRRIAMDLDSWDRVDRGGRENAVGRRLSDGAPLTGGGEHDAVDLEARDASGLLVVDTAAHVRRARTDDPSQRFLRRVWNYDEPPAAGAVSDSGQLFVTFQRDVTAQFVPVQARLAEADLMNLWTTPVGSAVFAVLPGAREGEHLAQALLRG